MGLFGSKNKGWPPTPYGYQPPPDADVRSWSCQDPACDTGEHGPDRRMWPKKCPTCGSPILSGVVSGRCEHAAEKFELDYVLADPRTEEWKRSWFSKREILWRYTQEARDGRIDGARLVRAELETFLTATGQEFDTEARARVQHAAEALPSESLANLQRWFEVVPRDDLKRGDRHSSVRTLIDSTVKYLEHPQVPKDAAYQQLWNQLRELSAQAQEYTTGDNDAGVRRLQQRLGHS